MILNGYVYFLNYLHNIDIIYIYIYIYIVSKQHKLFMILNIFAIEACYYEVYYFIWMSIHNCMNVYCYNS
jgi:hypothetical protein